MKKKGRRQPQPYTGAVVFGYGGSILTPTRSWDHCDWVLNGNRIISIGEINNEMKMGAHWLEMALKIAFARFSSSQGKTILTSAPEPIDKYRDNLLRMPAVQTMEQSANQFGQNSSANLHLSSDA